MIKSLQRLAALFGFALAATDAAGDQSSTPYAAAVNQFGFELYQEVRSTEEENFLISPLSVHTALGMAFVGSGGQTCKQIADVLQLPAADNDIGQLVAEFLGDINAGDDGAYALHIANRIWIRENFPVRESYTDYLAKHFSASAENLDFSSPDTLTIINRWAETATRGKIDKLINELDEAAVMVIGNAVYFLGEWVYPFRAPQVERQKGEFYVTPSETVQVEMMDQRGPVQIRYTENQQYQAVELPYLPEDDPAVSMLVVLPRQIDGLADIEQALSIRWLDDLTAKLEPELVRVQMPRFTQRARLSLAPFLKHMGMQRAFSDKAEFPGITNAAILISDVAHEAYIRVDEKGTEAAAVTGVTIGVTNMPVEPPHKLFQADRPFLFFIRSIKTGAILFVGRFVSPESED